MSQKRQKHTDQEWISLIRECMASNQPVRSWCEQHNMTTKAFYYHTRRLRQKGYPVPQRGVHPAPREKQEVVCLDIPGGRHTGRPLEEAALHIRLREIHIELMNHAGQEVLTNLFHALTESC